MKRTTCQALAAGRCFQLGYGEQGALYLVAFNEGEPPGKHLHEDSVFNWLRRAGGPYLVAFNEGKPAGRHLHEDGVGNWLRRAGGPYLVAFNEAEPPGKHLHEDGGPYLVAFNEGETTWQALARGRRFQLATKSRGSLSGGI